MLQVFDIHLLNFMQLSFGQKQQYFLLFYIVII